MYPEITSYNLTSGMGNLFVYSQAVVPFFDSLFFGFILSVLTFGMYFTQEVKSGRGDFLVSFAVGSFVTTILMGIMQSIEGFIRPTTLGIFISITIVSFLLLFMSKD